MHNKPYVMGSEEYYTRMSLFEERSALVAQSNCEQGKTWTAGLTHLADWTEQELAGLRGYARRATTKGSRVHARTFLRLNRIGAEVTSSAANHSFDSLPESKDWGHLEALQGAHDQGGCGSCWAYAAQAVLNAHTEIHLNKKQTFSVSQIIACTPNPMHCGGAGGCEGATCELAFEYALEHGLSKAVGDDSDFTSHCRADWADDGKNPTVAHFLEDGSEVHRPSRAEVNSIGMTGWKKLPSNKAFPLMQALVELGPLGAAVVADFDWNVYWSGVMTASASTDFVVNHAVVIYGYGVEGSQKFWRIHNSWGDSWGENGNLRMSRRDDEESFCGWDNQPEVGVACAGGPEKVWVCGNAGILYDVSLPLMSRP